MRPRIAGALKFRCSIVGCRRELLRVGNDPAIGPNQKGDGDKRIQIHPSTMHIDHLSTVKALTTSSSPSTARFQRCQSTNGKSKPLSMSATMSIPPILFDHKPKSTNGVSIVFPAYGRQTHPISPSSPVSDGRQQHEQTTAPPSPSSSTAMAGGRQAGGRSTEGGNPRQAHQQGHTNGGAFRLKAWQKGGPDHHLLPCRQADEFPIEFDHLTNNNKQQSSDPRHR
ncbi:hypothetical protein ACLOJK_019407 [Asimina triloba]